MILHPHLDVNDQGHLTIGGVDTVEIAREFGTPAYVLDEAVIRENCRIYRRAAAEHFGADALPLYASKALCFAGIYRIAAEEGMGVDCVSGGELYTAKAAGFPAEKIYFHGNNKTDRDICNALDMGVGTFVVDNADELEALSAEAQRRGAAVAMFGHTHEALCRYEDGLYLLNPGSLRFGSSYAMVDITDNGIAVNKKGERL